MLGNIFPQIQLNLRKTAPNWSILLERKIHTFDTKMFNLPKKHVKIGNYLQCFKYFQDIFGKLYTEIFSTFHEDITTMAQHFIDNVVKNYVSLHKGINASIGSVTVCLHVRAGRFPKGL